jgi:hypothetical protein
MAPGQALGQVKAWGRVQAPGPELGPVMGLVQVKAPGSASESVPRSRLKLIR